MDPYVYILHDGKKRKSSIKEGAGKNPEWNEKFVIDVKNYN